MGWSVGLLQAVVVGPCSPSPLHQATAVRHPAERSPSICAALRFAAASAVIRLRTAGVGMRKGRPFIPRCLVSGGGEDSAARLGSDAWLGAAAPCVVGLLLGLELGAAGGVSDRAQSEARRAVTRSPTRRLSRRKAS